MLGRNILESSKVIGRAMIACENSGHSVFNDFPEVRKIVEANSIYSTVGTRSKKSRILSDLKNSNIGKEVTY
ncbi:MAG: hypothetical protein K6G88_06100 [Lachnospiraceae bacterium]|nr:hypothetical protein [Lachnospiraceae bacterium]